MLFFFSGRDSVKNPQFSIQGNSVFLHGESPCF
jgi:hypothetical protein